MTHTSFAVFLGGVFCMGFAVIGVMFLKFWRQTGEALFVAFAVAFWLLALSQAITALLGVSHENVAATYLPRLAAFVLILLAIVAKNLAARSRR